MTYEDELALKSINQMLGGEYPPLSDLADLKRLSRADLDQLEDDLEEYGYTTALVAVVLFRIREKK